MTDALVALIQQYRETFPQKIGDLEQALAKAEQTGWQPNALEPLASLIHRLAGSAGAYGFSDIHQQATAADHQLKALRQRDDAPPPADIEQIRRIVNDVIAALKTANNATA